MLSKEAMETIELFSAFCKALDVWLGNNGNETNEKEFRQGWDTYLEKPGQVKEMNYDYNAGVKAAKEYVCSIV